MSNTKKVTREGSGRTLGATSFVTIRLGDLCSKLSDPNTLIKVSRIQMQALGLNVQGVNLPTSQVLEKVENKPVIVTQTDFDSPSTN